MEVADEFQDFGSGVGIEIAGGLVGQEDRGIEGERAGDGYALTLAAGKLVGEVVEALSQLDELEQGAGALVDLLAFEPLEVERQGHIFEAGEARQEIEKLEDEADFVAAEAGEVIVRKCCDRLAVDADLTGGGPVETADEVEEGRFAGAGGADDGDHLAPFDVEIDGIEGHYFAFAVEMFGDAGEGDHLRLTKVSMLIK